LLELQELLVEPPEPGALHEFHIELELATRLVQRHNGRGLDRVALAWLPAEQTVASAEHDTPYLRDVVLEDEVPVSAGCACQVGNLALNPHQREAAFQEARNGAVQR